MESGFLVRLWDGFARLESAPIKAIALSSDLPRVSSPTVSYSQALLVELARSKDSETPRPTRTYCTLTTRTCSIRHPLRQPRPLPRLLTSLFAVCRLDAEIILLPSWFLCIYRHRCFLGKKV